MKLAISLFIALFTLPLTATAANYYVDNTKPNANDNNPGTSTLPWQTLRKAAITVVAGDIVTVGPGGVYDERVQPINSGAAAKVITYRAAAGTRPRVRRFDLIGKSYITMMGFEITNSGMTIDYEPSFYVTGTVGVRIINNYVHDTLGVFVRTHVAATDARNLYIGGNIVTRIGPAGARTPIIQCACDNTLIENNDLSRGEDFIRIFGNHNVIRNNVLHDGIAAESAGNGHLDGIQGYCSGGTPESWNYVLLEGNVHRDNPGGHDHFALINDTMSCGGTKTVIVRHNLIHNVGSYSFTSDTIKNAADHHKYYNNTTVNGGIGVTPKVTHTAVELTGGPYGSVLNNIFYDAIAPTPPAQVYLLDASGTSNGNYNLAYLSTGAVNFANPINAETNKILNVNPQFVSTTNFNLRTTSPARGAGGHLTTVDATDIGSDVYLKVVDAHFFQDGWAGVTPDTIAVGSSTNTVRIVSIDYANNIIQLAAPITRLPGQPVWLAKNSTGVKVMYGSRADIGAYPFVDIAITVETKADGTGTVLPSQILASGSSVAAYAIQRDASGNFISNVAATWSLTAITGAVVSTDLVVNPTLRSALFTGHGAGTAIIRASVGGKAGLSGVLTVSGAPGPPAGSPVLDPDLDGSAAENIGIAHVRVDSNGELSDLAAGIGFIGLRMNGVLVTEAALPAVAAAMDGRIYAEVGNDVSTSIAFSNPNAEDAIISFSFTDTSGAEFGFGSLTLPAKSQLAGFLNRAPFHGPADLRGTFTYRSSIPIASTAFRGLVNERAEYLLMTMPVSRLASAEAARTLAHFADGAGWTTKVILRNDSDSPASGTLQFFGQGSIILNATALNMTVNGVSGNSFSYSIPPHGLAHFATEGGDAATRIGSIRITPEADNAPSATAILTLRAGEVTTSSTAFAATAAEN